MEVLQQRLPIEVCDELTHSVFGPVVLPHAEDYPTTRASWHAMIDRKPMERIMYGRQTEIITNGKSR